MNDNQHRTGILLALGAFLIWGGVAPIYFKLIKTVPPMEIWAHRVLWSMVILVLWVKLTGGFGSLKSIFKKPHLLLTLGFSGCLIVFNWFLFIYAIETNQILESSLGYFILPLVNVLFGMIFLRERLGIIQYLALALTAIAVLIQLIMLDSWPDIALGIAFTFGFYTLIRKKTIVDATVGLCTETLLTFPMALAYLLYLQWKGELYFFHNDLNFSMLLIGSGLVTALPMALYVGATKRLPLSTLGFLQYVSPTGQFLVASYVFLEPINDVKLASFFIIWIALTILITSSILSRRA